MLRHARLICFLSSAALLSCLLASEVEFSDDFHTLPLGEARKAEFIALLLPLLEKENRTILRDRQIVLDFFDNFLWNLHDKLQSEDFQKIVAFARAYKIGQLFCRDAYLLRIDIVPISLALAQAALESGWGSSSYSRKYNNFFGEYTTLSSVPSHRIAGSRKRIRVFESIEDAVRAYMWNLNTHYAYAEFRKERLLAHSKGEGYTGTEAMCILLAHFRISEQYAHRVATLMARNLFERLDWEFYRKNQRPMSKQQRLLQILPVSFRAFAE